MRFVFGLIFGVILTIGGAYLIDTMHSAPGPDQKEAAHMVNWTIVSDNLRDLSTSVQDGWYRLTGHTHQA
jgi:hypothetical protein